jgi:type 2 lantibiotic biosynthesis protein LanM
MQDLDDFHLGLQGAARYIDEFVQPWGIEQTREIDRWTNHKSSEIRAAAARYVQFVAGSEELTARRSQPAWISRFCDAYRCLEWQRPPDAVIAHGAEYALGVVFWPIVDMTLAELSESTAGLGRTPHEWHDFLCLDLFSHLFALAERTLALELAVLRHDSGWQDSFDRFTVLLSHRSGALEFFHRYPVLARVLMERADAWRLELSTFFERFRADKSRIAHSFGCSQVGCTLVELETTVGDLHMGHSVIRLEFECGTPLFYKPRAPTWEQLASRVDTYLSCHGLHLDTPTIVAGDGSYFWQHTANRTGHCATDLHCGNVIGSPAGPQVIDGETILDRCVAEVKDALSLCRRSLADSVLAAGLLPMPIRLPDGTVADLSALCAVANSEATAHNWHIVDSHLIYSPKARGRANSLKQEHLADDTVTPAEVRGHIDDICSGFRSTHRAISCATDEEILEWIAGIDSVRVLLRNTWTYGKYLDAALHPANLRSGIAFDMALAPLWAISEDQLPTRVVAAEHVSLRQTYIPFAEVNLIDGTLYVDGDSLAKDLTVGSAAQRVLDKVRATPREIDHQVWLINGALSAAAALPLQPIELPPRVEIRPALYAEELLRPNGRDPLLEADKIGRHLEQTAFRHHNSEATWIGLDFSSGTPAFGPIGTDLYSGTAGVALFLAELAVATGDKRYEILARQALACTWAQMDSLSQTNLGVGFFDGLAGISYAAWRGGSLFQDEKLNSRAIAGLTQIRDTLTKPDVDLGIDVISGLSGVVLCLREMADASQEVISDCLESMGSLIARGAEDAVLRDRRSADSDGHSTRMLAGFGHGASGVALALGSLSADFNRSDWGRTASALLTYEDTLYDNDVGNYRDLRADSTEESLVAWCHGSPGSLLARLVLAGQRHEFASVLNLSASAAREIERRSFHNDSLCHGAAGTTEILVRLAHVGAWKTSAADLIRNLFTQAEAGWRCGFLGGVQLPSIGLGLAGIGYQCLRLADMTGVPSLISVFAREPLELTDL